MSDAHPADVLIVGGGIAGVTTATALRALGYAGKITLIESEPRCTDHPPLSKRALVTGCDREELDLLAAESASELDIRIVSGCAAIRVDATAGQVELADGSIWSAAAIVVAIGAEPNRPVAVDNPNVVTLRGYDDAMRIRAAAGRGRTVLVWGSGFVGAEVTASLAALETRVVLVDPHERPGSHVLGETLAGWLHDMHAAHGVDVRQTRVEAIADDESRDGLMVALADGTNVVADLVVAGVGVTPRVLPGAEKLMLPRGLRILPDAHWEAARFDGQAAAARLLGQEPSPRGAAWYWTDRYDHHIEVVGDLVGTGRSGSAVDVLRAGSAVFRVDGDIMLGAASIDDPMTVRAARRIIDRQMRVDARALADPSRSLRQMLRK
ncbi:FAD/NAD(P)-binding oxidoreductase [Microbacterium sp. NPDC076911]|uniref:NAD(P)/FAD-dependent oxidoreductase n=1 Tax=Microbacterium sp. NPDC076911 TaxID=3154958 RepID=UPI00341B2565